MEERRVTGLSVTVATPAVAATAAPVTAASAAVTTATAPVAAEATTATTAATPGGRLIAHRPSLVDDERASAKILAIAGRDGPVRFVVIIDLDEAEAA